MGPVMPSPGHWTEELFLRHADVYLPVHERAWAYGEEQARDLRAILEDLGVAPGARILDAPCGIGRHATHLATLGYRAVGVDLSPVFIEHARRRAADAGVSDRTAFHVGDLRSLRAAVPSSDAPFDAAVNLWTSLGYYDEATDERILRGYRELVRPGGVFLLYIVNREFLVRRFEPHGYDEFGDIVHIEDRHLDLSVSRMRGEWRFFRKRGEDLDHITTVRIDHRAYGLHELRALFERTGWRAEAAYGGYKRDPPSTDSPTLLVVGRA
jgi:SAM-dependent methyltransferase